MLAHSSIQIFLLLATGCVLFDNVQPNEEVCGKIKVSTGRVHGGEEVQRHSIPWQVAIFDHKNYGRRRSACGGTLISSSHVLTAAHCMEAPKDCSAYSVGIGMHKDDALDGTRVAISHISNHPSYNGWFCSGAPDFDFSILHLASPVDFNKKVLPACLPDESLGGEFLAGKDVTVSGWGAPYPGVLHKATYPAVTNEECKKYNDKEDCSPITTNTLCAGNPHNRTASHGRGDSGGPLTYNNNGRETVVGVVSWSDKCDGLNGDVTSLCNEKLAVYARVTAQLDWIKKEMETNYDTCK